MEKTLGWSSTRTCQGQKLQDEDRKDTEATLVAFFFCSEFFSEIFSEQSQSCRLNMRNDRAKGIAKEAF